MKKSLIALAVLTASGISFAQSSVTLSGKLNVGIASTNGSKAAMTGGADGSDSRVIFRGVEDLGGGLKANFHLENGFKPDTGNFDNTANQLFQRQAWGGLSGGFGEVRAGRQYTLGFFGSIGSMPSTYTDPALAVNLGFSGMGSRNSDQIQYWSPTMSGVQLRLSTQLAGDTSNASTPATKTNEFGLSYAAGPLSVNLTGANVTATDNSKTSPMGIYGAYDFGAFAAHLGYVDKDNITGDKGTVAKVTMPIGANTLFVGMAKNSTSKADAYEVGNFYALSKRTRVYALYANGSNDTSGSSGISNGKRVSIGLDHNF